MFCLNGVQYRHLKCKSITLRRIVAKSIYISTIFRSENWKDTRFLEDKTGKMNFQFMSFNLKIRIMLLGDRVCDF